eukprot:619724-Pleurochrysis_carterae.AAC.1
MAIDVALGGRGPRRAARGRGGATIGVGMTEGYGQARDTSCYQVTTLSSIAEVRVLEPVTQRGQ